MIHYYIDWFDSKFMMLNVNKCHLLLSGYKHEWNWAMVRNERTGKVKVRNTEKQCTTGIFSF